MRLRLNAPHTGARWLAPGLMAGFLVLLGACGKPSDSANSARAEQELQQLRADNQELQRLRADNQDLPRLRRDHEEAQRIRDQTKDLARLREENAQLRGQLEALKAPKPRL